MDHPTAEQQDSLIAQFCGIAAGVSHNQAQHTLAENGWDLELALAAYFGGGGGGDSEQSDEPTYTGPRTLDGRPAAEFPSSSGNRSSRGTKEKPRGGMRTLQDLQNQPASDGHTNDEDEDDDEENQDLYAGGEKSGLSVQNPSSTRDPQATIREIIRRAGQNAPRDGGDGSGPQNSHFTGTAHTLGGDDVPSQMIPDPSPQGAPQASPERRELHIWRNGFSVDDGPLYRYDDPANAHWLNMINRGQAPLEIMNVQHGQEVDVQLHPHRDEDYIKPKKKYKPFSGQGQRLGSPTPGSASIESKPTLDPPNSSSTQPNVASPTPTMDIDSSQPTITLQIRLGDGTRLRSQFNTAHTIGNVYDFVDRATPESARRTYVLMTTFPSKELVDRDQALGGVADFKRGGVVVQKWT